MEDIEHRPVVIPKATYDVLLKQDEPLGLIALYNFYYYTAVWQKTNQPKSTTAYTAKGLKVSATRIRRYKKKLLELSLIEDIQVRSKDNTHIAHHYIKVKYYTSYPNGFVKGRKSNRVENRKGNACRDNKRNAYSNNTVASKLDDNMFGKKLKKTKYEVCTIKLYNNLKKKNKICRKPNIKTWNRQFKDFYHNFTRDKKIIKKVLIWYCKHIGEEHIPEAFCVESFCKKFVRIESAMNRTIKNTEEDDFEVTTVKKGKYITHTIHYDN